VEKTDNFPGTGKDGYYAHQLDKIHDLTHKNNTLQSRIAELESDNTALRQRIEKMNDYLRNNGMEPF